MIQTLHCSNWYPAFEPSDEQLQNMKRLSKILLSWGSESRPGYDSLTLADLYREQGRFDEAEVIILAIDQEEEGVVHWSISQPSAVTVRK